MEMKNQFNEREETGNVKDLDSLNQHNRLALQLSFYGKLPICWENPAKELLHRRRCQLRVRKIKARQKEKWKIGEVNLERFSWLRMEKSKIGLPAMETKEGV